MIFYGESTYLFIKCTNSSSSIILNAVHRKWNDAVEKRKSKKRGKFNAREIYFRFPMISECDSYTFTGCQVFPLPIFCSPPLKTYKYRSVDIFASHLPPYLIRINKIFTGNFQCNKKAAIQTGKIIFLISYTSSNQSGKNDGIGNIWKLYSTRAYANSSEIANYEKTVHI